MAAAHDTQTDSKPQACTLSNDVNSVLHATEFTLQERILRKRKKNMYITYKQHIDKN